MRYFPLRFPLSPTAALAGLVFWAAGLPVSSRSEPAPAAPRLTEEEAAERFTIDESENPSAAPAPAVHPAGYHELLAAVTPSVVSVFPQRLVTLDDTDDPISRFFRPRGEETDETESEEEEEENHEFNETMGVGSGVILSADGWIVTNSHVVHLATGKLADAVSVELSDRRRFPAKIVGADPLTDLALLKIDSDDLVPLPIGDSDSVKTGDLVFAVGNPFQLGMTATMGMVSATQRTSLELLGDGGYESFIQTDAAINPGNSGGALVDARGRLIGINTAIYGRYGGNIGIGFAIPTRLMTRVVTGLAREGEMRRGFFGIETDEVDQERAEQTGAPRIAGAWVADVMTGGPAESAGLRTGDVIAEAGGRTLETRGDLRVELSCLRPGDSIELSVHRRGEEKRLTITAAESRALESTRDQLFSLAPLPGVKFRLAEEGLEVAKVDHGKGTGDRTALVPGMVISHVNGNAISSAEEAVAAFRKGINKVVVVAGDTRRTLAVRVE